MKEEMRIECDRALHEKTSELEELRRASEDTIDRLRKQLQDVTEDRGQPIGANHMTRGDLQKELLALKTENEVSTY